MGPIFLYLALILQSSLIFANDEEEKSVEYRNYLQRPEIDDEVVKDGAKVDWMDMFLLPSSNMYPTSSAAMMSQVFNSDKCAEEQLQEIKDMARKICAAMHKELANVLDYVVCDSDKHVEDNHQRKRRAAESPMDSTQLVMRLLKHIKTNNDYQNIAIEKMMNAQEIAEKFGIEFTPDPEILSDLALAGNEQTLQLSSILEDACDVKNETEVPLQFVPLEEENCQTESIDPSDNNTYYVYSVQYPQENYQPENAFLPFEYAPEQINYPPVNHGHYNHAHHDHAHHNRYNAFETQIMPPPHHHSPPVTPNPNFYDSMMNFAPGPEFYPFCPMEPITTTTTIILPIEEPIMPEPELVGEEYEEIISSKVMVDRDEEPGSVTVNHVTTHTLSEKAHFKTPQIERLPEQMQYTFFLM